LQSIREASPIGIVISPGPGAPADAGECLEIVSSFSGIVPILGVCLGHQAIGEAFGARVVRAPRAVHGKTSAIVHDGSGIFSGIPSPFSAARYHSLLIEERGLPSSLRVNARTADGLIMSVMNEELMLYGVQFHPESFMTEQGDLLIGNFLAVCEYHRDHMPGACGILSATCSRGIET
jgi:anthranilate synthase/aminodeoxychorismate synthase-like glutamine amidotransferase